MNDQKLLEKMKKIASPFITFGVLSSKYLVFEISSKKICILLGIIYKFGFGI